MTSTASPKKMVSSVFITLSSPHRATVTQPQQQQNSGQTHSVAARDKQCAVTRGDPSKPAFRHKKQEQLPSEPNTSTDSTARPHPGASVQISQPQTWKPTNSGLTKAEVQEETSKLAPAEHFPLPPPPPPATLETTQSEDATLPPPPPELLSQRQSPWSQPLQNIEEERNTPSSGLNQDEQSHRSHKNSQDTNEDSKDVCGFCRKTVALSEPAIEALNRTYHDSCFQCRSCHVPLAGKLYYNKAGIPLCEDCYQATLELCWTCGEVIKDRVIHALERAYHPSCFTCTTCSREIGGQRFAQGEVGEVYCLQDYYRKYAPKCSACNQLIIPKDDGTDSYTLECLGSSYHEDCYRCQVCAIKLSPEPTEHGCYPLDGKMLCKSCHLSLVSGQH
ncbi:filamin-binding LIM protein 1 isoform X2 [Thalassophryne amazonica]|uniref:filamin-binding LIM protein 1 isoform X2 n=1 Tax=Thalassophryne amazonica TaxID=390379 RepID=UPI0014725B7C|nr:filamin-binding LIM protein 1 isoform X2 [Thalassophryne amazonica]